MKKLGVLLLGLVTLLPAYAQEPPADVAAPADATAPAGEAATPAEPAADQAASPAGSETPAAEAPSASASEPPADAAAAPVTEAPADGSAAPADTAATADAAPADSAAAAPTETASAETAPAESVSERKPWQLYAGYDYTHINMQITSANPPNPSALQTQFGGDFFTTNFHQVRAGMRLFDVIGLEGHYGFKSEDGNQAGKISLKNYGGIYIVPTGTVLDTVELSALIGYTFMTVERPGAEAKLNGVSYGVNLELPIRLFSDALPDLRFGGGIMMYHRNSDSRTYGAHFGLRYDFKI